MLNDDFICSDMCFCGACSGTCLSGCTDYNGRFSRWTKSVAVKQQIMKGVQFALFSGRQFERNEF